MLEHLRVGAVVRRKQRFEDLLTLVRQLPPQDPVVRRLGRPDPLVGGLEKSQAIGDRNEKERVVAHLYEELHVDLFVGEVRVRLRPLAGGVLVTEPERTADRLL